MKIVITKAFAPNSAAAPFDVLQMKKSLNRLGYYIPSKDIGITDIPDSGIFTALKTFQKDFGLSVTGTVKPDDDTITAINRELEKPQTGYYVWNTVGDDRVRGEHEALEGTIRAWDDSPDPSEDFNCRCWAEPAPVDILTIYDPPIRPVYPEIVIIPLLRTGKLAVKSFSLLKSILNEKPKLNTMQAENLNRFIKKIPANSKSSVKITSLRDGSIRFQATSLGKVNGTKAIYEKTVDANGQTTQYFKTTIGKDNKIIHIKNKMSGD